MKQVKEITRKRVIIEAEYLRLPTEEEGLKFIEKFSKAVGMTIVYGPFAGAWAHQAMPDKYGAWEAYAIWAESGIHMYVWEKAPLITFEIFTCKEFDIDTALRVIKEEFEISRIAYRNVDPPLE